ncbi:MAG TPA: nucleotidyltransferase family protein [Thermoanaerobaculia bacterium]|jgi:hypothetical protein|nr:nucleotidyltransferase family protein [Thermoanaerobaculia bacterium]
MHAKALPDADRVVRFCLGSEEYKRREAGGFSAAVGRMDRDCLVHLLYHANLLPLFGSEIERLGIEPSMQEWIRPYRVYQGVFNEYLLGLLNDLAKHLESCRPVLLKGPAFWVELYPDPALRPVKDLDLLALDADSTAALCHALATLGFAAEFPLALPGHYELPEFKKTVEVDADEGLAEALREVLNRYSPPRLHQLDEDRFSLTVPIEVHTALFLFTDGSRPDLEAHHLADWRMQPTYRVLTAAANLPYLSVKLDLDARRHVGRSLKLLADLVRILARATPEEIALSLETAAAWHAGDSCRLAFNTLATLTPEIDYLGLPAADHDLLSDLVLDILNHETAGDPQ